MAWKVNIKGLEQLKKKVAALPAATRNEIADAMAKGAGEMVDFAQSLAPHKTLQDSIGWSWGDLPKGKRSLGTFGRGGFTKSSGGSAAKGSGTKDDLLITVYAGDDEAFYARWVEFGTKPHSLAKGAILKRGKKQTTGIQHPGTAATPFFFPAYRALRKRINQRIRRAINKAAKRVAQGGR
jgi:HK97 gp10 family phage protein